jgi:hypothetical protein
MITKTLLAALLAAVAVGPALADKPGAAGCPPGLAKKHNGCQPPGQATKMRRDAVVGHHVPPYAVFAVPRQLRAQLPRPPAGYRYAIVNDQVVLVSGSNIVVDIIRDIVG